MITLPARIGATASARISTASWYAVGNTDALIPGRHRGTVIAPIGDADPSVTRTISAETASSAGSATIWAAPPTISSIVSRVMTSRDSRSSSTSSSPFNSAICSWISSIRRRTTASRRASSSNSEPIVAASTPHGRSPGAYQALHTDPSRTHLRLGP